MLFSMTIQAWNLVFLNPMTFQAQWSPCYSVQMTTVPLHLMTSDAKQTCFYAVILKTETKIYLTAMTFQSSIQQLNHWVYKMTSTYVQMEC